MPDEMRARCVRCVNSLSGRPKSIGMTAVDTQPTEMVRNRWQLVVNRHRLAEGRRQLLVGRRSAEVRGYRRPAVFLALRTALCCTHPVCDVVEPCPTPTLCPFVEGMQGNR